MIVYALGFFIACLLGIFGTFNYSGGSVLALLVWGEIGMVALIPLGVCVMSFGVRETDRATWNALEMLCSNDPQPLTPAEVAVIKTAGKAAYLAGWIGALLGTVITLGYLDSEKYVIAHHVASSLTAISYALVINTVLIQPILRRSEWLAAGGNKEPETPIRLIFSVPGVITLLLLFLISLSIILPLTDRLQKNREAETPGHYDNR